MSHQLTRDPAYDTVEPDDFGSMIQTQRYGRRSPAFDKIIASTHDHFWDPLDPAYIDYNTPFDMVNNPSSRSRWWRRCRRRSPTGSTRSRRSRW